MNDVIIFCAKYLLIFVGLGIVLAWLKTSKSKKPQFLVAAILGGIVALILSRIAGKLYFDPRPFVTQHIKPLIPHPPDNGFPSDHALLTMNLTAITYFYSRRIFWVMLVLTAIVGAARVLAHVHSPVDIVGGWVLGAAGAAIGYYLALQYFRSKASPKQKAKRTT